MLDIIILFEDYKSVQAAIVSDWEMASRRIDHAKNMGFRVIAVYEGKAVPDSHWQRMTGHQ